MTANLDFSEHTLRMGYGSLSAVEALRRAGIEPAHTPGFRAAIFIVDDAGWAFTPTALYLEPEPQSMETPNGIALTAGQVEVLLPRLCPVERLLAIADATLESPEETARLEAIPLEVGDRPVDGEYFAQVEAAIAAVPPVPFDVVRQVRVFEPYLQYVELSLTGAAVQRHRVRIPKALQNLGSSKDLEGKLKTTFDLLEKGSELSSRPWRMI